MSRYKVSPKTVSSGVKECLLLRVSYTHRFHVITVIYGSKIPVLNKVTKSTCLKLSLTLKQSLHLSNNRVSPGRDYFNGLNIFVAWETLFYNSLRERIYSKKILQGKICSKIDSPGDLFRRLCFTIPARSAFERFIDVDGAV